jgi:serine/threonine protein kinase
MVALKLIKIGMDSRVVLARFDAERQALALMDHPNIARVYDGGTTEAGQPFFVMELVRGEPITDYCDRRRLSVRARLELFGAKISSAIQASRFSECGTIAPGCQQPGQVAEQSPILCRFL